MRSKDIAEILDSKPGSLPSSSRYLYSNDEPEQKDSSLESKSFEDLLEPPAWLAGLLLGWTLSYYLFLRTLNSIYE